MKHTLEGFREHSQPGVVHPPLSLWSTTMNTRFLALATVSALALMGLSQAARADHYVSGYRSGHGYSGGNYSRYSGYHGSHYGGFRTVYPGYTGGYRPGCSSGYGHHHHGYGGPYNAPGLYYGGGVPVRSPGFYFGYWR
jgi:hypothetical protein